jgi:hypothetical protein
MSSIIVIYFYKIGSSWNRVGEFRGWKDDKAVDCAGILHSGLGLEFGMRVGWHADRSEDGGGGMRSLPWFSSGTNGARHFC